MSAQVGRSKSKGSTTRGKASPRPSPAKKKAEPKRRRDTVDEEDPQDAVEKTKAAKKDTILEPAEHGVRKAVEAICKIQASPGLGEFYTKNLQNFMPESYTFPTFSENKAKNRYQDVVCLEDTRVKLQNTDGKPDYVHANFLRFDKVDRVYIVTQHPMENTIEDFWRMVFYENVETIIALVNTTNPSTTSYWPMETGKFGTYGAFFVNCRKVVPASAKYSPTTYCIEILPDGCSNSHFINLYNYPHWGKSLVPTNPRVVLKLIRMIKSDKLSSGPVVVHSESGLNRSGTLVLADVITTLAFKNSEFDLGVLFKRMRNQRASMIQFKFSFIYACYVFLEYVKIRCKRAQLFPDLVKEIDAFEQAISKRAKSSLQEMASVMASEPKMPGGAKQERTICTRED